MIAKKSIRILLKVTMNALANAPKSWAVMPFTSLTKTLAAANAEKTSFYVWNKLASSRDLIGAMKIAGL